MSQNRVFQKILKKDQVHHFAQNLCNYQCRKKLGNLTLPRDTNIFSFHLHLIFITRVQYVLPKILTRVVVSAVVSLTRKVTKNLQFSADFRSIVTSLQLFTSNFEFIHQKAKFAEF